MIKKDFEYLSSKLKEFNSSKFNFVDIQISKIELFEDLKFSNFYNLVANAVPFFYEHINPDYQMDSKNTSNYITIEALHGLVVVQNEQKDGYYCIIEIPNYLVLKKIQASMDNDFYVRCIEVEYYDYESLKYIAIFEFLKLGFMTSKNWTKYRGECYKFLGDDIMRKIHTLLPDSYRYWKENKFKIKSKEVQNQIPLEPLDVPKYQEEKIVLNFRNKPFHFNITKKNNGMEISINDIKKDILFFEDKILEIVHENDIFLLIGVECYYINYTLPTPNAIIKIGSSFYEIHYSRGVRRYTQNFNFSESKSVYILKKHESHNHSNINICRDLKSLIDNIKINEPETDDEF